MEQRFAKIFNIQHLSTEDGPGIRTTIFFKGCPLRCIWCQNPEGLIGRTQLVHDRLRCIGCLRCINNCPNNAIIRTDSGFRFNSDCTLCLTCTSKCPAGAIQAIGYTATVEDILGQVKQDMAFYNSSGGGVTLSGGECLMQHEFLLDLIPMLRRSGIHVCLDTSGYAEPHIFQAVAEKVDMVLYDLKEIDNNEHHRLTGVLNNTILENARWLGRSGVRSWIRVPIIPGCTDNTATIERIADFIAAEMNSAERIDLLGYNDLCADDYVRLDMEFAISQTERVKESTMVKFKQIMEKTGIPQVTISNYERGL